jgi:hypothetical protein
MDESVGWGLSPAPFTFALHGPYFMLALGYGSMQISRNKRENANFAEDIVTVIGLK